MRWLNFIKKSLAFYLKGINMEAKEFFAIFCVSDKVRVLDSKQAFLSVKNHKDDFFLQNHLFD